MQVNAKMVGAGVAAAIAAGLGYALLFNNDEEVEFDTVLRDGAFSVRNYPQLTVAETIALGMRESALALGFLTLADYLDGKTRGGPRLGMTAPVLADGDDDGRGWRTRFVLPTRAAAESMPVPGEGIRIRSLPARQLAAARFSGDADDGALEHHEDALRSWMEARGLRAAGPVEHAFYNSPFVPGMLRRNEVLIPLAA